MGVPHECPIGHTQELHQQLVVLHLLLGVGSAG